MAIPKPHPPLPLLLGGFVGVLAIVWPAWSAVDEPPRVGPASSSRSVSRSLTIEQLDARLRTLAQGDERIAGLLASIDAGEPPATIEAVLSGDPLADDERSDMALRVAAEHLASRRYEHCLAWLEMVDADESSSPELCWHYRAVAHHQLVNMPQAGDAAGQVLQLEQTTSRRVHEIAELIQRDAKAHKEGTLDHIAHQMGDVSRQLSLGRSGDATQTLQQEVIDSLDKMIEEFEEQRKQQQHQQQQQMAQGGRGGSAQPMQESRPADHKGAGDVDDRELPPGGDWGSLPPAERERVAQQIIRDFPSHYREVIEDYFRSLATTPEQEDAGR